VSRGLLYFNQPGRLVRGPELVTGESAWAYRQGDRVGIYVDLQRGRLAFFLNGRQIAPAHDDPDLQSCLEPLHPAVVLSAIIVACACARVDGKAYAHCRASAGEATRWYCSSG
jgi:hypothetical protein